MWKCDYCDRLIVFKGATTIADHYMKVIDAAEITEDILKKPHKDGIFFSEFLMYRVDSELENLTGNKDMQLLGLLKCTL